ncbi:hypothetical protein MJO29_007394, partial [Puccinia striiformis f. sp. tritici]
CILTYAPDGSLIHSVLHAPGSWHDSTITEPLYNTPNGCWLISDTSFPPKNEQLMRRILAPILNNQLVSAWQAAEWGMHSLQGLFAPIKLPLPANDHQLFIDAHYGGRDIPPPRRVSAGLVGQREQLPTQLHRPGFVLLVNEYTTSSTRRSPSRLTSKQLQTPPGQQGLHPLVSQQEFLPRGDAHNLADLEMITSLICDPSVIPSLISREPREALFWFFLLMGLTSCSWIGNESSKHGLSISNIAVSLRS